MMGISQMGSKFLLKLKYFFRGGSRGAGPPTIMILLSWNCRGLDNSATILALCELVKARRSDVVFLYETLVAASGIEEIRVKLKFSSCFNVHCVGRSDGICVL